MTNDDKTSCNFTSVEELRISQREDIVQVLESKHFRVSQVNTHLLSLFLTLWLRCVGVSLGYRLSIAPLFL